MQNRLAMAGRGIGMLAGGVMAMLWVAVIWFPVGGFTLEGYNVAVGAVMAAIGLTAAIASWHGHATVIFFCFVLSFFGIGTFALNVDNWFRIFGILPLLLCAASVMIWYSRHLQRKDP
jgi:hypothetical protein